MPKGKKIDAVVEDVKIYDVYDLWGRKPRGLGFKDTDAIVVTAKTPEGKKVTETFYVCIKPDGTLDTKPLSRHSRFRLEKLVRFLKHYKITERVEDYNITERIDEWKGKRIEVVPYAGSGYIKI